MIKVVWKNGTKQFFKAHSWNFRDSANNNVWLIDEDGVTVHLNWAQVRYVERLADEELLSSGIE